MQERHTSTNPVGSTGSSSEESQGLTSERSTLSGPEHFAISVRVRRFPSSSSSGEAEPPRLGAASSMVRFGTRCLTAPPPFLRRQDPHLLHWPLSARPELALVIDLGSDAARRAQPLHRLADMGLSGEADRLPKDRPDGLPDNERSLLGQVAFHVFSNVVDPSRFAVLKWIEV